MGLFSRSVSESWTNRTAADIKAAQTQARKADMKATGHSGVTVADLANRSGRRS